MFPQLILKEDHDITEKQKPGKTRRRTTTKNILGGKSYCGSPTSATESLIWALTDFSATRGTGCLECPGLPGGPGIPEIAGCPDLRAAAAGEGHLKRGIRAVGEMPATSATDLRSQDSDAVSMWDYHPTLYPKCQFI